MCLIVISIYKCILQETLYISQGLYSLVKPFYMLRIVDTFGSMYYGDTPRLFNLSAVFGSNLSVFPLERDLVLFNQFL